MYMRINKIHFILALLTLFSLNASASSATNVQTEPTKAQRQVISERHKTMAEMHSKMASCLESDKTFAQCHQEMNDSCATSFADKCPMMRQGKMGGRGKGMMNGGYWDWMMNPSAEKSTPSGTSEK